MAETALHSAVISYLWREYRRDPGLSYDIGPICRQHKSDPVMMSTGLRLAGLIKDDVLVEGDEVRCSLSVNGILTTEPEFVESAIDRVLAGMGEVNSIGNVMQILDLPSKNFQLAFDLANEMQNRDLVKLLYAFQPGSKVNVEMTLEGIRRKKNR